MEPPEVQMAEPQSVAKPRSEQDTLSSNSAGISSADEVPAETMSVQRPVPVPLKTPDRWCARRAAVRR